MKRYIRKLFCILSAAVMVVSLTACKDGPKAGDTSIIDVTYIYEDEPTDNTSSQPDDTVSDISSIDNSYVGTDNVQYPNTSYDSSYNNYGSVDSPSSSNQQTSSYDDESEKKKMYVDWNQGGKLLQVVQRYSSSKDFVMVMRPTGGNKIFNIAPPKIIKDSNAGISKNIAAAEDMARYMSDSDWIGPHYVNGNWAGGTHYNNASTGYTDEITVKIDGKTVKENTTLYADKLEVSWKNYIYSPGTQRAVIAEQPTLTFDGTVWNVKVDIEFIEDVTWQWYYGMQCVYGPWNGTVSYNGGTPIDITDSNAQTKADSKMCDTMLLRKGNDCLEMRLDRSYGIGDGRYLKDTDEGARTQSWGVAVNGKAYFMLVPPNSNYKIKAGEKVGWRGQYRFYYE